MKAKFGDNPPAPPHWGGYLVRPSVIEFWQGRHSRLHDRLRYTRSETGWQIDRLSP
jgi:pyridoxamine 5'-phosphate oxidase